MIKEGAGIGGINDLIYWSDRDFYVFSSFLSFVCDVKAASSILATLTSLEQYLQIVTVTLLFLIQCLSHSCSSHLARKRQLCSSIFYQRYKESNYEKVNCNISYILIQETGK